MWWKKAARSDDAPAASVEDELKSSMEVFWQPLVAALATGELQAQAPVQAFLQRVRACRLTMRSRGLHVLERRHGRRPP